MKNNIPRFIRSAIWSFLCIIHLNHYAQLPCIVRTVGSDRYQYLENIS